jgi:hypothetical protein
MRASLTEGLSGIGLVSGERPSLDNVEAHNHEVRLDRIREIFKIDGNSETCAGCDILPFLTAHIPKRI